MSGSLFDTNPGIAAGLLVPGNINLSQRPKVKNADGSISTVRSMSFTDDKGQNILIPTVIGDRVVSDGEAIRHYYKTGQHLGIFTTPQAADTYAESLHQAQAKQYGLSGDNDFVNQLLQAWRLR